jgi:hypothetical protein
MFTKHDRLYIMKFSQCFLLVRRGYARMPVGHWLNGIHLIIQLLLTDQVYELDPFTCSDKLNHNSFVAHSFKIDFPFKL